MSFRAVFSRCDSAPVQDLCAAEDHGCEQLCVNVLGSFVCQCYSGFMLAEDGKRCVGEYSPALLNEEGQAGHSEGAGEPPTDPSTLL